MINQVTSHAIRLDDGKVILIDCGEGIFKIRYLFSDFETL